MFAIYHIRLAIFRNNISGETLQNNGFAAGRYSLSFIECG